MAIRKMRLTAGQFTKGAALILGARIIGGGSMFLVAIILVRVLPTADVGMFFVCQSWVIIIGFIFPFGANTWGMKEIAEHRAGEDLQRARSLTTSAALLASATTVALAPALLGVLLFLDFGSAQGEPLILSVTYLLWAILHAGMNLTGDLLRGWGKTVSYSMVSGTISSLILLGLLSAGTVAEIDFSIQTVFIINVFALICTNLFGIIVLTRTLRTTHKLRIYRTPLLKDTLDHGTSRLRTGFGILVSNLALMTTTQVSLILLGLTSTNREVALYAVATRVIELIALPLSAVSAMAAPIISRYFSIGDKDSLEKLTRTAALAVSLVMAVGVLFFLVVGDSIIVFIFGVEYAKANLAVLVYGVGRLITCAFALAPDVLLMTGSIHQALKINLISMLVLVVSSLFLGNYYGSVGAAISISVAFLTRMVLSWYYIKSKLSINSFMEINPSRLRLLWTEVAAKRNTP